VGTFWVDAESLFETARHGVLSGSPDCDLAVLIGDRGGIQMLEAAGWTMPGLVAHYGAQTAYRITRERGSVRLEGRSRSETCVLKSVAPAEIAHDLLAGCLPPAYARHPSQPALLAERAATHRSKAETWATFA